MSWQAEVDEIARRRAWALEMGGREAVARHHERGRLTVRERIDQLCDTGSFREVGQLTGAGKNDAEGRIEQVTPAPYRTEEPTSELQSLMRTSYAVLCLHTKQQ